MGAELFHADRRTDGRTEGRKDMTKLRVVFRNFVNVPNEIICVFTHPVNKIICFSYEPYKYR